MPGILDQLAGLDTAAGELARDTFENPPLVGEMPADTVKRQQNDALIAERQKIKDERAQRMTGLDFASRSIPTYSENGQVKPVTDFTGAPLTQLDKSNSIAWDSLGEAKKIVYGAKGPPVLSDPFETASDEIDKKGNTYKVTPGLPWKWTGTDADTVADSEQKTREIAVRKAANAVGGKLTLDQRAATVAATDYKRLGKEFDKLSNRVGIIPESEIGASIYSSIENNDPVAAKTAIESHFKTLYDASDANETTGFFSSDLSPEAKARRKQLDTDKALTNTAIDRMLATRSQHTGAQTRMDATRLRADALATERANAALVAAGMPPMEEPDPLAAQQEQLDAMGLPVNKAVGAEDQADPSKKKADLAPAIPGVKEPKPIVSQGAPTGVPDRSFGSALSQGIDQPLEAIGTTAEVFGAKRFGKFLKGLTDAPVNYESASERFGKPQEGDFTVPSPFGDFAPAQIPRAITEQFGQLAGSLIARVAGGLVGAAVGGAAGSVVPAIGNVAGVAAGATTGQFIAPFLFGALQIAGPTALERAKLNGRTDPNGEDIAAALVTAAGSGALDALGTQYLPGGKKLVGSMVKNIVGAFYGEAVTEGLQSVVEQTGETLGTVSGLDVSLKQALGEGIIGGLTGATATGANEAYKNATGTGVTPPPTGAPPPPAGAPPAGAPPAGAPPAGAPPAGAPPPEPAPNGKISSAGMLSRAEKHLAGIEAEIAREENVTEKEITVPNGSGGYDKVPNPNYGFVDQKKLASMKAERDALANLLAAGDAEGVARNYGFEIGPPGSAAAPLDATPPAGAPPAGAPPAGLPSLTQQESDQLSAIEERESEELAGLLQKSMTGGALTETEQTRFEELQAQVAARPTSAQPPPLPTAAPTAATLENNRKLSGWNAQWALATTASAEGVDLTKLSREEYADYAVSKGLKIDAVQLRRKPSLRMAKNETEYNGLKNELAAITPEQKKSAKDFNTFAEEVKRQSKVSAIVSPGISVRGATANSSSWLFWKVNKGASSDQNATIHKAYAGFSDIFKLTPDRVKAFLVHLQSKGFNGGVKTVQKPESMRDFADQIVMHGATEADAKLALAEVKAFFGDELNFTDVGIDRDGKSHSQVLADRIKQGVDNPVAPVPVVKAKTTTQPPPLPTSTPPTATPAVVAPTGTPANITAATDSVLTEGANKQLERAAKAGRIKNAEAQRLAFDNIKNGTVAVRTKVALAFLYEKIRRVTGNEYGGYVVTDTDAAVAGVPTAATAVNHEGGWFYRGPSSLMNSKGWSGKKGNTKFSTNVTMNAGLISDLDTFVSDLQKQGVDAYYKTPDQAAGWESRHDPVSIYASNTLTPAQTAALAAILSPHVRSNSASVNALTGNKIAEGIFEDANPSKQQLAEAIAKAKAVGGAEFGAAIEAYLGNGKKASTGQLRAVNDLLNLASQTTTATPVAATPPTVTPPKAAPPAAAPPVATPDLKTAVSIKDMIERFPDGFPSVAELEKMAKDLGIDPEVKVKRGSPEAVAKAKAAGESTADDFIQVRLMERIIEAERAGAVAKPAPVVGEGVDHETVSGESNEALNARTTVGDSRDEARRLRAESAKALNSSLKRGDVVTKEDGTEVTITDVTKSGAVSGIVDGREVFYSNGLSADFNGGLGSPAKITRAAAVAKPTPAPEQPPSGKTLNLPKRPKDTIDRKRVNSDGKPIIVYREGGGKVTYERADLDAVPQEHFDLPMGSVITHHTISGAKYPGNFTIFAKLTEQEMVEYLAKNKSAQPNDTIYSGVDDSMRSMTIAASDIKEVVSKPDVKLPSGVGAALPDPPPAAKAGEGERADVATHLKSKDELFAVGDAQRNGAPESKMLEATRSIGGGVMGYLLEHVGDLTHRMADRNTFDTAGYAHVKEKVEKALRTLRSKYGFLKEHLENKSSNAKYGNLSPDEYESSVRRKLKEYRQAHEAIPTFNRAQSLAQDAAVQLSYESAAGVQRAIAALQELNDHLGSVDEWVKFAHQSVDKTTPAAPAAPAPKAAAETEPLPSLETIQKDIKAWEDAASGKKAENRPTMPASAAAIGEGTVIQSDVYKSEGETTILGPAEIRGTQIVWPALFGNTQRSGYIQAKQISKIVSRPSPKVAPTPVTQLPETPVTKNTDAAIPAAAGQLDTDGGKAAVKVRKWLNDQFKAGNKIGRYASALDNLNKKELDPDISNTLTQLLREVGVEDAPLSFEGKVYDDFWLDFSNAYNAPLTETIDKPAAKAQPKINEKPKTPPETDGENGQGQPPVLSGEQPVDQLLAAHAGVPSGLRAVDVEVQEKEDLDGPLQVAIVNGKPVIQYNPAILQLVKEKLDSESKDFSEWIKAAVIEEHAHVRFFIAVGAQWEAKGKAIFNALTKPQQQLLKDAYGEPGSSDFQHGGEYVRMLFQFRSGVPVTEIFSRSVELEALYPVLEGPQSAVVEEIFRQMQTIADVNPASADNAPTKTKTPNEIALDKAADDLADGLFAGDPARVESRLSTEATQDEFRKFLARAAQRTEDESVAAAILEEMEENDISPQSVTERFKESTYDNLPEPIQKRFQRMIKSVVGLQPGDAIYTKEEDDGSITAVEAKSWKDVIDVIDAGDEARYLQGTERGLIVMMHLANKGAGQMKQTTGSKVEGMKTLGAGNPAASEQQPIPPEKAGQLVAFASAMLATNIRSPEAVAKYLEEKFKGKARSYTRAIWEMMGAIGGERGEQNWNNVYKGLGTAEKPEAIAGTVAERVRDMLLRGEKLNRRTLTAIGDDEMDAKELDEQAELGVVMAGREIAKTGASPSEIYDQLLDLYERQPNFTAKTSTSKINQAYSTPIPLAYLGSHIAQISQNTILQESTAGNGALAIEANPNTALINEIDPTRAANLRLQGFTVSSEDATKWTPTQKADRLHINPPFGTILNDDGTIQQWTVDGLTTNQVDHAIVIKSLGNLKNDGRAVLIIGGTQAVDRDERRSHYGNGNRADFFKKLYAEYGVIDHFTVNGSLYEKQGAGWPVDVIVIAGRKPSPIQLPNVNPPRILNTWAEVKSELTRTDEERIKAGQYNETRDREELSGNINAIRDALNRRKRLGGTRDLSESPVETDIETGDIGVGDNVGTVSTTDLDGGIPEDSEGGKIGVGDGTIADGTSVGGRLLKEQAKTDEAKSAFHKPYVPVATGKSFGIETPANLAEPQRTALEAIEREVGKPLLEYVREKVGYDAKADMGKYFAAEQIDAIASAIYNIENNGALILGDMAGVGKGRVIAALIEYAKRNDLIPIFVTKNATLYSAMLGDFQNIGRTINPLYTNSLLNFDNPVTGETIKTGNQKSLMNQIERDAKLPDGFDAIFTTYDQIGKDVDPTESAASRALAKSRNQPPRPGPRTRALESLTARRKTLVMMDESHLGAGASIQGMRLRKILTSPNLRAYYSSATFAKRADAMPLYFKTNLRKAAGSAEELLAVFESGGVVMQQVASSMLAKDGQYIRRERSFEGIPFETRINTNTESRDRKLANEYTRGLRGILDMSNRIDEATKSMNKIMARIGKRMNVPTIKMEGAEFSSQIHNFVKQYLFAIKAEAAAEQAIKAIKEGYETKDGTVKKHKVIIAVENTMEGPIKSLDAQGQSLNFTNLLLNTLNGLRKIKTGGTESSGTATYFTINRDPQPEFLRMFQDELEDRLVRVVAQTDSSGATTQVGVVNEPVAEELFRRLANSQFIEAEDEIKGLELGGMPLSPIDYIRQKAEAAGIRTGEITGRSMGIDSEGNTYLRDPKDISKRGQLEILNQFNNTDLDLLIINASASTGISAHADENFDNLAPRMMIIAQPHLDINEFVQTLGRIFRSGQVENPRYMLLQTALPAEKRPAAITAGKMASLNANTTSNVDNEVSEAGNSVDIFNEYGDAVVWRFLADNPQFVTGLQYKKITSPTGVLLPISDILEKMQEDGKFARNVANYGGLLEVEMQDLFWEDVVNRYNAQIAYLDQLGENKLKAGAEDLGAETLDSAIWTSGDPTGKSIFDSPSFLETVAVRPKTPPMEPSEVMNLAKEAAKTKSATLVDYRKTSLKFQEDYLEARKAKTLGDWSMQEPRERERLREQFSEVWAQINRLGNPVKIVTKGGQKVGAIIGFEIDPEYPLTPSKQIFIVANNTLKRTFKIPASQMAERVLDMDSTDFEEQYNETREDKTNRYIITGNLVAASAKLNSNTDSFSAVGAVTVYTKSDGTVATGIMLPGSFNPNAKETVRVTTSQEIEIALNEKKRISGDDGKLAIVRRSGKDYLEIPASKAGGGKYWQDQELNRAMEGRQFVQVGSLMRGEIANMAAVVQKLQSIGVVLTAPITQSSGGPTLNAGNPAQQRRTEDRISDYSDERLARQIPTSAVQREWIKRGVFPANLVYVPTPKEQRDIARLVQVIRNNSYNETGTKASNKVLDAVMDMPLNEKLFIKIGADIYEADGMIIAGNASKVKSFANLKEESANTPQMLAAGNPAASNKEAKQSNKYVIGNLTAAEAGKLKPSTERKMVEIFNELPSTREMAAVALGGEAKRGWYKRSAEAILHVFQEDAPRFAALLAATSPQTSVETNLRNALNIWKNWTDAGRPTDRDSIVQVMSKSVGGSKGVDSILGAWIPNTVRALASEDPIGIMLSGPKVDSFMRNLLGNVQEVTNDAWMANYALVDQSIFSGSLSKTDAGKGAGYLAMSAKVRSAAKYLTKLTGEEWTPAEVQETIWSWAKTLYEARAAKGEIRTAQQILDQGGITKEMIAATPDFSTLFADSEYGKILKDAGYEKQLATLQLKTQAETNKNQSASAQAEASPKATSAFAGPEQQRAARRLEKLYQQRQAERQLVPKTSKQDASPQTLGAGNPANADDIERANKTARTSGAIGGKAITPRYVAETVKPGETVLNFGAGKPEKESGKYAHSELVKSKGAKVSEYDFGKNSTGVLGKKYYTVFASNVLNVQSGEPMLRNTLEQIKGSVEENGRAVFNYPDSPRYSDITPDAMANVIGEVFGEQPVRVGGTKSAPLWSVGNTKTLGAGNPARSGAATPRVTLYTARHATLEAKYNANTITPEETAEAQRIVDASAKEAGAYTNDDGKVQIFIRGGNEKGKTVFPNSSFWTMATKAGQKVAEGYRDEAGDFLGRNIPDAPRKEQNQRIFAMYRTLPETVKRAIALSAALKANRRGGAGERYYNENYEQAFNRQLKEAINLATEEGFKPEITQALKDGDWNKVLELSEPSVYFAFEVSPIGMTNGEVDDQLGSREQRNLYNALTSRANYFAPYKSITRAYLMFTNPLRFKGTGNVTPEVVEKARADRYDVIWSEGAIGGASLGADNRVPEVVVLSASQVKSAEPFTGTPLSERFNPDSDSILKAGNPARPAQGNLPITSAPSQTTSSNIPPLPPGSFVQLPSQPTPPNTAPGRIDSVLRRIFSGGRWFWEGTADVLERAGYEKLAKAIKYQFDVEAREFGEMWKPIRSVLEKHSTKIIDAAKKEFADYFQNRENGRDAYAATQLTGYSAAGQELIAAWKKVAVETGLRLTNLGVEVQKPDGSWRPIGNLGEKFFPRKINQATMKILEEPEKYPVEWKALMDALIANGNIATTAEAEAFLKEHVFYETSKSDYFATIERARTGKLPESWLEYKFDEIAPWYVTHYARRSGQIEAYGQEHKGGDLFDKTLAAMPKRKPWSTTQAYVEAAKDAAYMRRDNTQLAQGLRNLQTLATGTFLTNPFSSIRNVVSGVTQSAVLFGPIDTLKASWKVLNAMRDKLNLANELGVLRDDMMQMMVETRLVDETTGAQALRKVANLGLTISGFNLAERFARMVALTVASDFARSYRTATGAKKDQMTAFLIRNDANPALIFAGDKKETNSFIRNSVAQGQGSYKFPQTPLYFAEPKVAFLMQFGKWGTQMTRTLTKHAINPAVFGTTVNGKQVRTFMPLLYAVAFAIGGGELLYLIRDLFTDRDRPDASIEEINKALTQNEQEGIQQIANRVFSDIIMAGTLGMFSDYAGNLREFATRNRFKNPFDPAGVQAFKNVFTVLATLKQQRTLTSKDIKDAFETQFSGAKFLDQTVRNITGNKKQEALQTQTEARQAGMRMAKELGMPVQSTFTSSMPVKSPKTPYYTALNDALLTGDVSAARKAVSEFSASLPPAERSKAVKSLGSSVNQKAPIKVGGIAGATQRADFIKWAGKRLPEAQFRRITELDATYWRTAIRAGVVDRVPQSTKSSFVVPLTRNSTGTSTFDNL